MTPFLERLEEPKPLLFDGGFGSELFARGIELKNSALANELHPEVVAAIHLDYIEAGADAIETNTFVASLPHLEMAGKNASEADEIVRRALEHARAAIDSSGKAVYLAGSVGPLPGAIEADGSVDFGIPNEVARDAHERVATLLAEGGIDFFCIETMFSAKEAAMAVDVARKFDLPIAVNLTYKYTRDRKSGDVVYRTDWGNSACDFLEILSGGEFSNGENSLESVQILGLNCGAESRRDEHTGMPYAIEGVRQIKAAVEKAGSGPKRLMAFPNAGRARLDKQHRTYYSQTPGEMAGRVSELVAAGARIIGGCCGTGPAHIKAFREAVDELSL